MNAQSATRSGNSSQPPPLVRAQAEFTFEEHLQVQRQIEQRANRLWRAHGRDGSRTFDHWLKAETEMLAEFIKNRMAAPNQVHTRTGGPPSSPLTVVQHHHPVLKPISTMQYQL